MASIEGAVSKDESGTDKDALSSDPSADAGAGVSELTDGTEELDGGAAELLDGTEELDEGAIELRGGIEELKGEAAELLDDIEEPGDKLLREAGAADEDSDSDELAPLSLCEMEEEAIFDAGELFEFSRLLSAVRTGVLLL